MHTKDSEPVQDLQTVWCLTKAQWKELSIQDLSNLSSEQWQQMPRSIFNLTPKKMRQVESAMKKFPKMDLAPTKRALAIIGLMYRNERDRRLRNATN